MVTFLVRFVGVMCHYDPSADPDVPDGTPPVSRRTIVIDGSHFEHPHEAYLEMPLGAALNPRDWPAPLCSYERQGAQWQRFTLDGVRLAIPSRDGTLQVDPSFEQYVPALGQVIYNFAPIRPEFVNFDPRTPCVAAHFDMAGGRLRALAFDPFPSQFEPPFQWPPQAPGSGVPLANIVELQLDVENEGGIKVVGEFYKRGCTVPLMLRPQTLQVTLGNLVPEEIVGNQYADRRREQHYPLYYNLSQNTLTSRPVPRATEFGKPRGASGGCPNDRYPP